MKAFKYHFLIYLFSILIFTSCKTVIYKTQNNTKKNISLKNLKQDHSTDSLIGIYKKELKNKVNRVLGNIPETIYKNRPESKLTNLIADATFKESNLILKEKSNKLADFSLLNYGGIRRQSISKGDFKVNDVFEIMPFENEMVLVELTPDLMQELISYLSKSKGHPISNLQIHFKNKKLQNLKINTKDFNPNKTYTVLTTDYLQNGGDQMFFLKKGKVTPLKIKMRDILLRYFEKNKTINLKLDQRFIIQ